MTEQPTHRYCEACRMPVRVELFTGNATVCDHCKRIAAAVAEGMRERETERAKR